MQGNMNVLFPSALSQEELKTWHYGPAMLCDMFKEERENGDFTWPEEAC